MSGFSDGNKASVKVLPNGTTVVTVQTKDETKTYINGFDCSQWVDMDPQNFAEKVDREAAIMAQDGVSAEEIRYRSILAACDMDAPGQCGSPFYQSVVTAEHAAFLKSQGSNSNGSPNNLSQVLLMAGAELGSGGGKGVGGAAAEEMKNVVMPAEELQETEEITACLLNSFTPATQVLMADGTTKDIKNVKIGDKVESTDPATNRNRPQEVLALHRNNDTDLADVTVSANGKTSVIHTTQHHRFWNNSTHKWTEAHALTFGTRLGSAGLGNDAMVLGVRDLTVPSEMRNLTVADFHTYYVLAGDTPVLVHNTCDHVVLGLESDGLDSLAGNIEGRTLMADKDWRGTVFTASELLKLDNPGVRVSFSLDGMAGAENGVESAVGNSLLRNARQIGGATDLEIAMLKDAGVLGKVDFYINGVLQPNPFR